MTTTESLKLALAILKPFAESSLYDDYKADEGFTDCEYEAMIEALENL